MRIHFVLNPHSGRVRYHRLAAAIGGEFAGHDIRISPELPILSTTEVERDGNLPGCKLVRPDMVVAVGGDGTVNRVINTVAPMDIPVGVIPAGSSNDFATALTIPADLREACSIIKMARLTSIDLISVNGTCFVTCGGVGLAGEVAARANVWRKGRNMSSEIARVLGRKVYLLAALRELCRRQKPLAACIRTGDGSWRGSRFNIFISNQPAFGGFCASPSANNRDGFLNICEMNVPPGRSGALWISLQTYRGRADTCREVRQTLAREVTISTDEPVPFFGDGEILVRGRIFRLWILPRALRVISPNGTEPLNDSKRGVNIPYQ